MRSGSLSESHVVFPGYIHSLDILLLPEAISSITNSNQFEFEATPKILIENEGMWSVYITPKGFVEALAEIPDESSIELQKLWMAAYVREYENEPDLEFVHSKWNSMELTTSIRNLIRLAKASTNKELTVLDVWTL